MQQLTGNEAKEFAENQKVLTREYGTFIGRTIKEIRPLTQLEIKDLAWDYGRNDWPAFVIIMDDGQAFIPSSDPEGNGPGFLITGDC